MQEYLRCDSSSKLKLAAGGAKPKPRKVCNPHICTNVLRVGTRLYIQSNPTDINRLLVCDVVLYGANLQRVLRAVRGGAAAATIAAES